MSHGMFEQLESSDGSIREASKQSQQRLAAAIYDVKEKYGDFIYGATALDEFHDRVALVKGDMLKTVDQHLMPVTGTMRRITKALKDEWRQRTARDVASDEESRANYEKIKPKPGDILGGGGGRAGYHPDESYIRGEEVHTRQADKTGPAMHVDNTFSPSDGDLVPEGDFKGYLDSVDQGAESKISDRFVDTETPTQKHTGDPAKTDFTKGSAIVARSPAGAGHGTSDTHSPIAAQQGSVGLQVFSDWCQSEGLRTASIDSLDKYAENLSDQQYFKLAAELQRTALGLGGIMDAVGQVGGMVNQGIGEIAGLAGGLGGGGVAAPPPAAGGPGPTNDLAGASVGSGGVKASSRHIGSDPVESKEEYEQHKKDNTYVDPAGGHHYIGSPAWGRDVKKVRQDSRRTAQGGGKTDYLQKADEALTNVLNQKAEEFQEGIAALQQALQIIQQNEAQQQMMNPMGVQPPAGTVNVLPDQAAAGGMPGGDPNAAAGGMPPAGGQPPMDPSQMMQTAAVRQMVAMAMSRKHYRQIADLVKGLPPEHKGPLATGLADMFKADNPNFSHDKWFSAVGHDPNALTPLGTRPTPPQSQYVDEAHPHGGKFVKAPNAGYPLDEHGNEIVGSIHKLDDPGECKEKDGDDSAVKGQKGKSFPKDWYRRDNNQQFVGKRQGGAAPFAKGRQK